MAKGTAVSSLLVQIGADISGLEAGGKQAAKSMQDLGKHARELGNKMVAISAAAAAAGAAMAAKLVSGAAEAANEMANLAAVANTGIEVFQRHAYAARTMGIQSDKLADIYKDVNDKVGDFLTTGAGPLADFFEKVAPKVGVTAEQFRNLSGPQALQLYVDSIERANLSQSQMTFFMEAIASDATMLVPLLRNGGAAMRDLGDEAERMGVVMSDVDIQQLVDAQRAMIRIGEAVKGIGNQIAIALAPYVTELAERLAGLSKGSNEFGSSFQSALEKAVVPIGWLADGLHGLHVIFKGLQLVAEGFGGAFYSVIQAIMESVVALNDAVARDINKTIGWFNSLGASIEELPLMTNSEWVNDFRKFADGSRERVARVRGELQDLAMQEMPSQKIAEFFEDVKKRASEAANAVAENQPGGGSLDPEGAGTAKEGDREASELEAQRNALQTKLDALAEYLATEDELEVKRYEKRMEDLQAGLDAELVTQEEYQVAKQLLAEKHEDAMQEIRERGLKGTEEVTKKSFASQAKTIASATSDMFSAFSQHSKSMFEINKIAGIANAIVSTWTGVAKALELPWPLNLAAAASTAAQGIAAVANIKSQSFGGGSAPSGAASAASAAPAAAPAAAAGGNGGGSLLTVEGVSPESLFSGRTVRALAERLAEHQRDGGTVQFA